MIGAPGIAAVNVRGSRGNVVVNVMAPNSPELVELVLVALRRELRQELSEINVGVSRRIEIEVRS